MSRIELFKQHLSQKCAVKIISGINNFDIEKAKMVVKAATLAKASAVDICADEEIIKMALETTNLPVFVSSIDPSELAKAVKLGDVAVEIGNYDALYKLGKVMDASQILEITKQTKELINDENVFMSVTVPGHISVEEQISLAKELEKLGVDLIQTEGACVANVQNDNTRGLIEMATVSIANTIELSRNIEIPVMTASGLTCSTVGMAFASGASAVGVGSCINKLNSLLEMTATATQIVEIAQKNKKEAFQTV